MEENYEFEEFYNFLSETEEESELNKFIKHLTVRIAELERFNCYLIDLIPLKYKKFKPLPGTNPFFTLNDIKTNQSAFEEARIKMKNLFKTSKLNT